MTGIPLHGRLNLDATELHAWLGQFSTKDRVTAQKFLEHLHFVSLDTMTKALTDEVMKLEKDYGSCAVFVEGPVRKYAKKPVKLYKHPARKKNRRSEGVAPPPVPVERRYAHETGSEGHIAGAMTSLARARRGTITLHPSMTQWRRFKHNRFVLVTDFIGSGTRVSDFLSAALKTPTINSWLSSGHIKFDIVTYSATSAGIKTVENHRANPKVHVVQGCPTIDNLNLQERTDFTDLCLRYCPIRPGGDYTPLGYKNSGGLIIFHHSAPNNTPLILHKATRRWNPLFKGRSPTEVLPAVENVEQRAEVSRALSSLKQLSLASSEAVLRGNFRTQQTVVVLAALRRVPRDVATLSARTGFPTNLIETTLSRIRAEGLVTKDDRLTERAFAEFIYLRKPLYQPKEEMVVLQDALNYIPKQLRPPVDVS